MKQRNALIAFLISGLALAPASVFAAEEIKVAFLQSIETPVEFLNVILSVVIAVVGVILTQKFVGGAFAKPMRYLAASGVMFATLEIAGILEKTEIFALTGLTELFELAFAAVFLLALYKLLESLKG